MVRERVQARADSALTAGAGKSLSARGAEVSRRTESALGRAGGLERVRRVREAVTRVDVGRASGCESVDEVPEGASDSRDDVAAGAADGGDDSTEYAPKQRTLFERFGALMHPGVIGYSRERKRVSLRRASRLEERNSMLTAFCTRTCHPRVGIRLQCLREHRERQDLELHTDKDNTREAKASRGGGQACRAGEAPSWSS